MFKDFRVETRDSLGNLVDVRVVPYYHPSYALKTPTQAYRPAELKYVRSYRGPTTVTYEDGTTGDVWVYFYNAPLGRAERIASGDYLEHLKVK